MTEELRLLFRAGLGWWMEENRQREKKEDERGLKKPLEGCRCKAFSFLYFHKPDSTIQDDPVSDGKGQGECLGSGVRA